MMAPDLFRFGHAADELRRQEFSRLADAVTPRIEAFRSMTPPAFRNEIGLMLERLGHTLITDASAPDLVTVKGTRKFITACAIPTDQAPTKTPALQRLHDAVVAGNAARGFYVTPRSFTPAAEHYAASAPVDLVDGALLIKAMHRSRKGVALSLIYKAMCRQCGEIVQHRIDQDEALPCGNGHLVAPTIAQDAIVRPRLPRPPVSADDVKKLHRAPGRRAMSVKGQVCRKVQAHNQQVRGRAIKKQRDDNRA
jgi:Restriction endonuclease